MELRPAIVIAKAIERAIANGWTFASILTGIRTGNPFTVTISGDRALTDSRTQRAQLWQPESVRPAIRTGIVWIRLRSVQLAPSAIPAFQAGSPEPLRFWTATPAFHGQPDGGHTACGRNSLHGPAYQQINFSLRRASSSAKRSPASSARTPSTCSTRDLGAVAGFVLRIQRHRRRPDSQHRRHDPARRRRMAVVYSFFIPALTQFRSLNSGSSAMLFGKNASLFPYSPPARVLRVARRCCCANAERRPAAFVTAIAGVQQQFPNTQAVRP